MADVQVAQQGLQWGRLPSGQFVITVAVQADTPSGKVLAIPTMGFMLSKDEEDSLLAALTGLQIAATLPPTNGRH